MPDPLELRIEGEALQMVNRMAARYSKEPIEMVQFALEHLNLMLETLQPGQSITITKKHGDSLLTVSDVLGSSDLDGFGD